ncbi:MAG: glycosyltransferase family 4 protein [Verrucomicrobiales bacterium]
MRVLFTCNSISRRGGVVTFTRELARALTSLGHEVRWFGNLRERGNVGDCPELPAITGPDEFQPDILHLQHAIPAYAALLAFRGVPAIFHCHGGTWKDQPFLHPRVRHYVAMSEFQAERLSIEMSLSKDLISVFLNPVDTSRFQPGLPLEGRQPAILVYHGRIASDDPVVHAIKEATTRRQSRVDFLGRGFGASVVAPERLLPNYPVVFASGLSAIEAMACGCAVVIFGPGGCGEMVGSENFDRLRARNFSIPMNCSPATPEAVLKSLDSYDPVDAGMVTGRIRGEADVFSSAREMLKIYQNVLDATQGQMPDQNGESLALASFFRWLASMVEARDQSFASANTRGEEMA